MSRQMARTSLTPVRPTAAEVVVREGFICPICMHDLGTIVELQEHFERDHTEEDKTILQQLKGILRKKVGRAESPPINQAGSSDDEITNPQLIAWVVQDAGSFTTHAEFFRKIRDNRLERFMVETNKLIIRLDKLVHEAPSDPRQRAVFEKHLASWVPDHDVPVCPGCGKSFKRFMRKHHCRLCGCVVCTDCSRFLDEVFVENLTNPVGSSMRRPSESRKDSDRKPGPALKRSNSNESLMSIMASIANKDKQQLVRVCEICQNLLQRRLKQMEEKHEKTELEDLNERITFSISDAENLYPAYQEMAASLQAGETNFQLQQAAELRNRLTRLFDTIDMFSKKISSLPETTSPKEQKLRTNVRLNAIDFLKSYVLTMSVLPSVEKCQELQRTRREEIKGRLAAKKAAEEEQKRQLLSRNNQISPLSSRKKAEKAKLPSPSKNPFEQASSKTSANPFEDEKSDNDSYNPFNGDDEEEVAPTKIPSASTRQNGGWAAEPVRPDELDPDDHPLLQQIAIVRKTIEQARKAGRTDEVSSLSENLKDLNEFYRREVLPHL